jgi:hypothetical protein
MREGEVGELLLLVASACLPAWLLLASFSLSLSLSLSLSPLSTLLASSTSLNYSFENSKQGRKKKRKKIGGRSLRLFVLALRDIVHLLQLQLAEYATFHYTCHDLRGRIAESKIKLSVEKVEKRTGDKFQFSRNLIRSDQRVRWRLSVSQSVTRL